MLPAETWTPEAEGLTFVSAEGGNGRFACGEAVQSFRHGDLLVTSEVRCGNLSPLNGKPLIIRWFAVSIEQLFPVFDAREIAFLRDVVEGFRSGRIYSGSGPLALQCRNLLQDLSAQSDPVRRSQLLRIAITVLADELKAARQRHLGSNAVEDRLSRIFEELSAEAILSLSVQQLAAKFGCSRRHLNRLFHRYFGLSAANVKMELRLLKALTLLRDADAKIIDVAHQSGFNHLGLFNTCFKKRFGKTPTQWRRLKEQRENSGSTSPALDLASAQPKNGRNHPEKERARERLQIMATENPASLRSLIESKALEAAEATSAAAHSMVSGE